MHIVPLGFEFDRVIRVFEKIFKPNRIYLLVPPQDPKYSNEMNDMQRHFNKQVEQELENRKIDVKFVEVDIFDILKLTNAVSRIILDEGGSDGRGSEVFVNVSAAGKLTSVGATLAVMAARATSPASAERTHAYYVPADNYTLNKDEEMHHGLSICSRPEWTLLPNFQIERLDHRLLEVLAFLAKANGEVYTNDVLNFLIEKKDKRFKDVESIIASRKPKPNRKEEREIRRRTAIENSNNLNKGVIKKLEKSSYIGTKKDGKYSIINITESGKFAVAMNGLLD